jgi:hypothetical protein
MEGAGGRCREVRQGSRLPAGGPWRRTSLPRGRGGARTPGAGWLRGHRAGGAPASAARLLDKTCRSNSRARASSNSSLPKKTTRKPPHCSTSPDWGLYWES